MDWEDLRHFLALAKAGSLSEAARQLKVDHTTVARRVAMLESALDLRLIDRLPRAVMLTPEGSQIAELGRQMEADAFAILRAAQGAAPVIGGSVRVSAPPAFANIVLAPRLAAILRERHPGIVVDLAGDPHMANLDRREADIALRLSRPSGDGLIARKIGEMPFALYATADYAENTAETDWAFIAHDDFPQELPQQRWLKTVVGKRSVVFRSNDVINLAAAAGTGLGVALLPDFLAERDPTLVRLPWSEPTPCRDIWMAVHDDLRRTPRIRAVMDVLIEIVANCA